MQQSIKASFSSPVLFSVLHTGIQLCRGQKACLKAHWIGIVQRPGSSETGFFMVGQFAHQPPSEP